MNLCLGAHDELYLINLDIVLYFQADDHYVHVFYTTGTTFMISFGLSKIETILSEQYASGQSPFLRLGRKYIINTRYLFHINTVKQIILLTDAHGNNHSLHISKPVLRNVIALLREKDRKSQ